MVKWEKNKTSPGAITGAHNCSEVIPDKAEFREMSISLYVVGRLVSKAD